MILLLNKPLSSNTILEFVINSDIVVKKDFFKEITVVPRNKAIIHHVSELIYKKLKLF